MGWVSKKREFFEDGKKMELRIFLRGWIDFAAKTEIGIVLEYFVELKLDLERFCPKRREKRIWI